MAENVEARLEQFIPGFEQLKQLHLFSDHDIKTIIKKRRAFEYALTSRSVTPDKFLEYIQFEAAFLEINEKRKEQNGIDPNVTRLLIDVDLPKHIHSIYRRALGTFPDNMKLWELYFDFCENRGDIKSLHFAFDDCIKRHANKPEIWIRAARWEMTVNNNVELAMKYMEQSVTVNPEVPELYAVYAETTIFQAQQIQQRREVQSMEATSDILKAPLAIFDAALKKAKPLVEVFKHFNTIFKNYNLDNKDLIEMASSQADPELLAEIAGASEKPEETFNEYLQKYPSEDLKIYYAKYLARNKKGKELVALLDQIDDYTTEEAEFFCKCLLDCGIVDDADDFLTGTLETNELKICKLRVIDARSSSPESFKESAKQFINKHPESKKLLNNVFLFYLAKKNPSFGFWFTTVSEISSQVDPDELSKSLMFTRAKFGLENTDKLIQKILPVVVPSPVFIETCVKILDEIFSTDPKVESRIRQLHETAVMKFGRENPKVWIDFCGFESKLRNWKKLEEIRKRAARMLDDSSEFSRLYQEKFCKVQN
ncbi:hypothetical protein TVAG_379840 [Trichomonas vaginalis G3]|uniref:U3 small nucleolar RNA-associated protein 6 N-terminal domain-containing protein n=1 Tax=Trichomonas vaginalis (strain ATCC PRA-98 / G3) TaxID=412133 RepID=A2E7K9_TRIV3|nr:snoRNA binding [Trichomonas vaginalis G3]EAY11402.1 hypothetical protein TVAG_379840 [Trichomonas vaginalis G3]KAI5530581.1 snoRNA binding [Trichomonas vaginalis G3]|eukprot:XP_001323625.1 hypothetical protein [Trichomonas vaginalis G3]